MFIATLVFFIKSGQLVLQEFDESCGMFVKNKQRTNPEVMGNRLGKLFRIEEDGGCASCLNERGLSF